MARKACFENFYEKVCETLIADNGGKSYDCLCDLDFDFEETLATLTITSLHRHPEHQ